MRLRTALAVAILASMPLASCSSGDDEPAGDDAAAADGPAEPADQGDGANDGGDEAPDGGAAEAPADQPAGAAPGADRPDSVREDFPVPFPSGWTLDLLGEIGMTNNSGGQLLYPSDAYAGIVAFYDEWFEAQSDEFARSVVGDQVFYQLLGETLYQVNVIPDHEERDETWTLIQVSGGAAPN